MRRRRNYGSSEVEFSTTILYPKTDEDLEDLEVTVKANVTPPTPPTLRVDPDDCDPGDPGEFEVISITRDDTGEDITNEVDHERLWDEARESAEDQYESAYVDAMEAKAEALRDWDW